MKNIFWVFIIVSLLSQSLLLGQEIGPPSLAIGAGEVLYEKGKLDAELIASIVSTKQDEVKKEIGRRLVLEKLNGGSYLLWHYTSETLNLIFNLQNENVIKKEMLKNATELMTVVAFTEFYLRLNQDTEFRPRLQRAISAFTQNVKVDADLISLLQHGEIDLDRVYKTRGEINGNETTYKAYLKTKVAQIDFFSSDDSLKLISTINGAKKRFLLEKNLRKISIRGAKFRLFPNDESTSLSSPSNAAKLEFQNFAGMEFLESPSLLLATKELGAINVGERQIYFTNLLVDIAFSVCLENAYLQQLGLFQMKSRSPMADVIDNYKYLKANDLAGSYRPLIQELDAIRSDFKSILDYVTNFSYAINTLTKKPDELLSTLTLDPATFFGPTIDKESILNSIKERKYRANTAITTQIKDYTESIDIEKFCEECDKSLIDDLITLNSYNFNEPYELIKAYYFLKEVAYPKLIASQNDNQIKILVFAINQLIESIRDSIYTELLLKYVGSVDQNAYSFQELITRSKSYANRIIDILNNLNKVESYEKVTKFIRDLGELSNNSTAIAITNGILNVHDKYITVNEQENKAEIDVEGVYLDLYERFAEQQGKQFSMYFSVGLNQTINVGKTDDKTDDSFNFVGEKIGVKFKLFDAARSTTFSKPHGSHLNYKQRIRKSRKPIIQDWHLLLFGSGLLYQIDVLNTESTFNSPLVGFGTGLSFFNGLDLNASYAVATSRSIGGYLMIGFDVKITEYLAELGKKRRGAKNKNGE